MFKFFKKKQNVYDMLIQLVEEKVAKAAKAAKENVDSYFLITEEENLAISYNFWSDENREITAELLEEIFNFILRDSNLNVLVSPSVYTETKSTGEIVDYPSVSLINGDDSKNYWKLEVAVIPIANNSGYYTAFNPGWYGNSADDINYNGKYDYYVELADYYRRACDIVSQRY